MQGPVVGLTWYTTESTRANEVFAMLPLRRRTRVVFQRFSYAFIPFFNSSFLAFLKRLFGYWIFNLIEGSFNRFLFIARTQKRMNKIQVFIDII